MRRARAMIRGGAGGRAPSPGSDRTRRIRAAWPRGRCRHEARAGDDRARSRLLTSRAEPRRTRIAVVADPRGRAVSRSAGPGCGVELALADPLDEVAVDDDRAARAPRRCRADAEQDRRRRSAAPWARGGAGRRADPAPAVAVVSPPATIAAGPQHEPVGLAWVERTATGRRAGRRRERGPARAVRTRISGTTIEPPSGRRSASASTRTYSR